MRAPAAATTACMAPVTSGPMPSPGMSTTGVAKATPLHAGGGLESEWAALCLLSRTGKEVCSPLSRRTIGVPVIKSLLHEVFIMAKYTPSGLKRYIVLPTRGIRAQTPVPGQTGARSDRGRRQPRRRRVRGRRGCSRPRRRWRRRSGALAPAPARREPPPTTPVRGVPQPWATVPVKACWRARVSKPCCAISRCSLARARNASRDQI